MTASRSFLSERQVEKRSELLEAQPFYLKGWVISSQVLKEIEGKVQRLSRERVLRRLRRRKRFAPSPFKRRVMI